MFLNNFERSLHDRKLEFGVFVERMYSEQRLLDRSKYSMEEMLKEIKEELKGFEKGTSKPAGGYFASKWKKSRNPEEAIAPGGKDGSDPAGGDDGASSLKKKPRKKRIDAGQKRGAKGSPEKATGSGAKDGSDPEGGNGGAPSLNKKPRKKRSDAGKKRGAKVGPEGASGQGKAKVGSDPVGGDGGGADGSKNKCQGSDSE